MRPTLATIGVAIASIPQNVLAQIRIVSPNSAIQLFKDTHGTIQGSTSVFGTPYYGDKMMGQLSYGESKDSQKPFCQDDYEMKTFDQNENDEDISGHIVIPIVTRDGCPIAKKVLVAQQKGAHAVVVVDSASSTLTEATIGDAIVTKRIGENQEDIDQITIPSLLVTHITG